MAVMKDKKPSGRPWNSGIYKEQTVQMRIPISLAPKVKKMLEDFKKQLV